MGTQQCQRPPSKSKARLARFEELNSKEFQKRSETQELYIPPGPRLATMSLKYPGYAKSLARVSYRQSGIQNSGRRGRWRDRTKGAGKSTLIKILNQLEKPDSGTVNIGESVQLSYVDQSRDQLDDTKTVWQEIANEQEIMTIGAYQMPSRAYVGRFNFKGTDQQKFIKDLSGGERNRVHLANC